MNLPNIVRFYLDQQGFPYRLIDCPSVESLPQAAARLDIAPRQIARTVLLEDASGRAMAILPCSYILDFSILCQVMKRDLDPVYGVETHHFSKKWLQSR